MDQSLLGHLHPILVHLPIGVLLLAFLFELLSRFRGYRKLKYAVKPSMFLGAVAAVIAAVTGYWLSQEGGYDEHLLMIHRNLGIGTAVLAVLVYVHRKYSIIRIKRDRKQVRMLLFVVLTGAVIATGHFGGALTHGEDYLFASATVPENAKPVAVSNPGEASVFADVVRPILEQKCFGCHSSRKQKGQLRLDTREWIEKGGKHGVVMVSGKPDDSELFKRITLSAEAEHHMPPRERQQLTSLEVDVISSWIEEGCSYEQKAGEMKHPEAVAEYLKAASTAPEIPAADEKVVDALKSSGVVVLPVAAGSHYLMVNFSSKQEVTTRDAEQIKSIAKNVVELDFTACRISPGVMATLSQLIELRKLSLRSSTCTDADLIPVGTLKNLSSLNVSSTGITDQGIHSLKNPALTKIFLYQTRVTRGGAEDLARLLPAVKIDTGNYRLPVLATDTLQYRRSRL